MRSSELVSPPDEAPLARLGLEGSGADSKDEVGESIDEAQKTRRYMKVMKYGSGSGGSIGRVKISPDVNRNGGARGGGAGSSAGRKNLVRLRAVR